MKPWKGFFKALSACEGVLECYLQLIFSQIQIWIYDVNIKHLYLYPNKIISLITCSSPYLDESKGDSPLLGFKHPPKLHNYK